jgi:hypothetical protein
MIQYRLMIMFAAVDRFDSLYRMGRLTMAYQLADFPFLSTLLLCCAVGLLVILCIPAKARGPLKSSVPCSAA